MDELKKVEQAIRAQEALRGILPDEQLEATLAALREKQAALLQGRAGIAAGLIQAQSVVSGVQINVGVEGSDPESLLRDYLRELARTVNRLPWTNVAQDYADPAGGGGLGLVEVYTQLDTTVLERVGCEAELRDFLAGVERGEAQRVPAQALLEREPRLLILGDPGSGKSTLLNYVTYVLAQAGLAPDAASWLARLEPWSHGALLPVRIELRVFAAWAAEHPKQASLLIYLPALLDSWTLSDVWPVVRDALRADAPVLLLCDGLDEVPTAQRELVVRAVQTFGDRYPQHRVVVTCRPYAYVGQPWPLHGFREVTLAPFDEAQRDTFVATWYAELARQGRLDAAEARARAGQLQTALRRRDLAGLARRPLLLTVMALLHSFRGQLPEDRTELYADAVDLLLRRWERRMGQEAGLLEQLALPGLKVSDLEAGLYEVAFRAHSAAREAQGTADIEERDLRQWLAPYLGGSWDKAGDFVAYVRERAGLLVRHKSAAYTFLHRTFQEFLAACHLVGQADYVTAAAQLARDDPARWREVFILAAGHAARTHRLGAAIAAVNALCPAELAHAAEPTAADYLAAQLAGEALQEIGLLGVQREAVGQALLSRVRRWLVAGLRADAVLEPRQRAAVGDILAELGDPRFRADAWYLPDEPLLGFVEIPAGSFVMGTRKANIPALMKQYGGERRWYETETPQHERTLPMYYMARYPVTVAQFRAFVQTSGYEPSDPSYRLGVNTHPVVWVSWHDAVAYCRWLTERLRAWEGTPEPLASLLREQGWGISLPSEAQWEKAARGGDGRIFPWGNEPEPNRANYAETEIRAMSAAGCFPGGASPYGVEEMSGNVLEWTQTQWQEGYKNYQVGLAVQGRPVMRSGNFSYSEWSIRCTRRYGYCGSSYRSYGFGFRVACSAPWRTGTS